MMLPLIGISTTLKVNNFFNLLHGQYEALEVLRDEITDLWLGVRLGQASLG